MRVLKSLLEGKVQLSRELAEFVYQCTTCNNCNEVCHKTQNPNIILNTSKWIDHVEVWNALRKDLVEEGFAPLEKHTVLIERMNNPDMKNPYGEAKEKKTEWCAEFPNVKETGELVFFGGCTMPLRQADTLKNMMKILQAAGKEIAISKDESCCGSIALRIGDEKAAMEVVKQNVENIKNMGANTVFTACAGCYRTLKKDYPKLLGGELPFEVKHITEVLVDMINNNEIPFKAVEGEKVKVTYHDPCHLGRHMKLYDVPRDIIAKIPGVELVEMKRNRMNAWCCGAGGGVKSLYPELALEIAKERVREAVNTGAQVLLTSCPFCIGNLSDALKDMDSDTQNKIQVVDIVDFIATKI